jgi:hypothetical protein
MLVHNEEQHIEEALESVLSQGYRDFKLTVSDNASTDKTLRIAESFAHKDTRVEVVQTPKKLISFEHWKWLFGLNLDDAPIYSMALAGHDILGDGLLNSLVNFLDGDVSVAIAYPENAYEIDDSGRVLRRWPVPYSTGVLKSFFDPLQLILTLLYNFPYYGIWRHEVRRLVPSRYPCTGADHLHLAEVALHGAVSHVHGATMYFRRNKPGADYHRKHFVEHDQTLDFRWAVDDFKTQLTWLDEIIALATSGISEPIRQLIRVTCVNTYILRCHLNFKGGGLSGLVQMPEVRELISAGMIQADIVDRLRISASDSSC